MRQDSDLKRGKYSHAKAQRSQKIAIKLGVLASLREVSSFFMEKQKRAGIIVWLNQQLSQTLFTKTHGICNGHQAKHKGGCKGPDDPDPGGRSQDFSPDIGHK